MTTQKIDSQWSLSISE